MRDRLGDRCNRCHITRLVHDDLVSSHEFQEKMKIKRRCYIREWSITESKAGSKWAQLVGYVYGHRKFMDGSLVTTSPILRLDIPAGMAETMNTIYVLEDTRG